MDNDTYNAIITIAFRNALYPDADYDAYYRKICRWFSREFSTPLKEVEDLAEEYVLMAYWEEYYSKVLDDTEDPDEKAKVIEELKQKIIRRNDPNNIVVATQEFEDDKWAEEMEKEIAKDMPKPKMPEPSSETIFVDNLNTYDNNEQFQSFNLPGEEPFFEVDEDE